MNILIFGINTYFLFSLGSPHDDGTVPGCETTKQYLMAPISVTLHSLPDEDVSNPFRLSACSQLSIKACLEGTDTTAYVSSFLIPLFDVEDYSTQFMSAVYKIMHF